MTPECEDCGCPIPANGSTLCQSCYNMDLMVQLAAEEPETPPEYGDIDVKATQKTVDFETFRQAVLACLKIEGEFYAQNPDHYADIFESAYFNGDVKEYYQYGFSVKKTCDGLTDNDLIY